MTTHAVGADNRKMYTINVAFPHLLPSSPTSFPFEKRVLMKKIVPCLNTLIDCKRQLYIFPIGQPKEFS